MCNSEALLPLTKIVKTTKTSLTTTTISKTSQRPSTITVIESSAQTNKLQKDVIILLIFVFFAVFCN